MACPESPNTCAISRDKYGPCVQQGCSNPEGDYDSNQRVPGISRDQYGPCVPFTCGNDCYQGVTSRDQYGPCVPATSRNDCYQGGVSRDQYGPCVPATCCNDRYQGGISRDQYGPCVPPTSGSDCYQGGVSKDQYGTCVPPTSGKDCYQGITPRPQRRKPLEPFFVKPCSGGKDPWGHDKVLPPGPSDTHVVKPNLEEMMRCIKFGMEDFLEETDQHLNNLQEVLEANWNWISTGMDKLELFDEMVEDSIAELPKFIRLWGEYANHFQMLHDMSIDLDCPNPDLNDIPALPPHINQETYSDLLRQFLVICQQADRQMRLNEIMYSTLDESAEEIKERLRCAYESLKCNETVRANLQNDSRVFEKNLMEKKGKVEQFYKNWMTGPDDLHRTNGDITKISGECQKVTQGPISGECEKVTQGPPMKPSSTNPKSEAGPSDPVKGKEEKSGRLVRKQRRPVSRPTDVPLVEYLVSRYNELYGSARKEVENMKGQNEILEKSLEAMKDIPQAIEKKAWW